MLSGSLRDLQVGMEGASRDAKICLFCSLWYLDVICSSDLCKVENKPQLKPHVPDPESFSIYTVGRTFVLHPYQFLSNT